MKHQQGLSLIELLIASAIGLVLSTAITQIVINTNQSSNTSESNNQAHEAGRFAISYMTQFVRNAGYFESEINGSPVVFVPGSTYDKDDGTGDILVTAIDPADPNYRTCNNQTSAVGQYDIIFNQFFVENDELKCQAYTVPSDDFVSAGKNLDPKLEMITLTAVGPSTSLVKGIDAIHIQYGIATQDSTPNNRKIQSFSSGGNLSDEQMSRIIAVKISILASSIFDSSSLLKERKFQLLDSDEYKFKDKKTRKVFSTTIAFNNIRGEAGL